MDGFARLVIFFAVGTVAFPQVTPQLTVSNATAAALQQRAKVQQNITATSEELEITGPVEATLAPAPAAVRPRVKGDETIENLATATGMRPTAPAAVAGAKIGTLVQAGPSAVQAAKLLGKTIPPPQEHVESLSFGESIFLLPNQRTQALLTKWAGGATGNGDGVIDPQIAVSRSAVAVLTWDTLAFYDKSGALLPSTAKFANPTNTETLFANAVKKLDAQLILSPQTHGSTDFLFTSGQVGDARLAFDNFRKRWVVVATAKNNGFDEDRKGASGKTWSFAMITSQRRTKFLLAVSKDEDPAKGWRTFSFNATPDDGACGSTSDSSPCPGSHFTPGNAGDYPSIGISKTHYIITDGTGHAPLDGSAHTDHRGYMVTVNARGAANDTSVKGHAFWDWGLGEGDHATFVTMPVVMHNDLPLGGAGWGIVASTVNDRLVLTGVSPNDPPQLSAMSWDVPDMQGAPDWPQKGNNQKITYGNVDGNEPITATFEGTTLTLGFEDCRQWVNSQNTCSPSLHLFTADLTVFPVTAFSQKDRVVGLRSLLDDEAGDVVAYGLPGIASNKDGDIAVVYGRTSPKMFMETRFSTWMHNEVDIRPSRELQKGQASISGTHPDTAGVALDPFDNEGIWIAHEFADSSGQTRIAVGKIFGAVHPDLLVASASVTTPTKGLKKGDPLGLSLSLANGGDGSAPGANGEVLLVASSGHATSVGHTGSSELKSGAQVNKIFAGTVPGTLAAGKYTVRVHARLASGVTQYSTDNDVLDAGEVELK
jgi:hypothetical protein